MRQDRRPWNRKVRPRSDTEDHGPWNPKNGRKSNGILRNMRHFSLTLKGHAVKDVPHHLPNPNKMDFFRKTKNAQNRAKPSSQSPNSANMDPTGGNRSWRIFVENPLQNGFFLKMRKQHRCIFSDHLSGSYLIATSLPPTPHW